MIIRKFFFAIILFIISNLLHAQINDDFADGDFTSNPNWSGDIANFEVNTEGRLHLNAPAVTDTSYLSVSNEVIQNATWEFFVEMDFDPSSSNFAKVYITSNQSNLTVALNGYFVKLGNTSDDISLYRQDGFEEVLLIDGADGLLSLSNGNDVKVKVTRDDLGNWELLADTAAGTTYISQGISSDLTYLSSNYLGVYAKYTSTRSDLFFFDDFLVSGDVFADIIPPIVQEVIVVSNNQLDVRFSEIIESVSGSLASNYFVNNSIANPSTVNIDGLDETLVHLNFASTFSTGIENEITISNITDLTGNIILPQSNSFTFIEFVNATYKNVVFNEIFADPTPILGLPDAEFIEIYNTTNDYFNLQDWKLINTTTEKILPDFILYPNELVILCDMGDTGLYNSFGNVLPISSFSTLSNDGDSLTLLNDLGDVIDIVFYDIDWYNNSEKADGGWTLELINPETPCSNSTNWTASNSSIGGSPGTINSVFNNTQDTSQPTINGYSIINATKIQINFSEIMNPNSLLSSNFTINNSNNISNIEVVNSNQSVLLTLINPIDTGVVYTISVNGATDCIGNSIASGESINFLIGYSPLYGDILINEIMADPTPEVGLPDAEYLELINVSDKVIDLSSSLINEYAFPENTLIQPNGFLVIIDDSYESLFAGLFNKVIIPWGESFLTNDGKELFLKTIFGDELDRINYSIDWYLDDSKNDGGWSLERINPMAPCLGSQNWQASVSNNGGTPGIQNSIYDIAPDLVPPILLSVLVIDENTIEMVFNEKLDTSSVALGIYSITNNIQVSSLENVSPSYTDIRAGLSQPLVSGVVYYLSVSDLSDCSGNLVLANTNSVAFGLPEEPLPGEVILNEALFYPRTGGSDFVEVYNNSKKIISLKNWKLANIENEAVANEKVITELPILLLPNDFCVLTASKSNIVAEYPQSNQNKFIQMDGLPTYNIDEGNIVLISSFVDDNDSIVINQSDRFDYSQLLHYPLIGNLQGISLERIDYNRPTSDNTNWLSAAASAGYATPGFKNSQYHQTGEGISEITIEPEVFSPDNDGYSDVVNITYKLENVGFTGSIYIYDGQGRVIRKLVQNELLPESGTVSWNGITDSNEKARVGMYVVYAEIFDLLGNVKSYKKPCVLGGKF
jgi:hypothetical protein